MGFTDVSFSNHTTVNIVFKIYNTFKGTVAWDGFLAQSIPYSVVRKNLKKIKICIIINEDIHTFMCLGVLGEYA